MEQKPWGREPDSQQTPRAVRTNLFTPLRAPGSEAEPRGSHVLPEPLSSSGDRHANSPARWDHVLNARIFERDCCSGQWALLNEDPLLQQSPNRGNNLNICNVTIAVNSGLC